MNYIHPGQVNSPKLKWSLIAVLDEGTAGESALALGRWEQELTLAIRWNGDSENTIGSPQSRGIPTWFIVPQKYHEAMLAALPADKLTLARSFIPAP